MPHTSTKPANFTKPKHITVKQLLNNAEANDLGTWVIPIKMRSGKEGAATILRGRRNASYSVAFRFPTSDLRFEYAATIEEIVEKVNEFIDIAHDHDVVYMKKFMDA